MVKIYTKTGDTGETSLFTGERVPKDNAFIEAVGAVDECNSAIGVALSLLPDDSILAESQKQLEMIQHGLFDVGAALATPRSRASESKKKRTYFDQHATELLEQWIDAMESTLPKLTHFILPGGHPAGAMVNLARSICRRAERRIAPLYTKADVSEHVFVYLNRLSDYLFVLSRHINHRLNQPETAWEHHKATPEGAPASDHAL